MNESVSAPNGPLRTLIARWRDDPGGAFRNWFLWAERLKTFRSIRRYSDLREHRLQMARFGSRLKAVQAVDKSLHAAP